MNNNWNIQYLEQLVKEFNISLLPIQDFDKETIQVYSRVRGICGLSFCNDEWDKSLRDLSRTHNYCCSKHSKYMKSHIRYSEMLKKITTLIPSIKLKYPTNEILKPTTIITFKCHITKCINVVELPIRRLIIREQHNNSVYDKTMYCCNDCIQIVSSLKKEGIKTLLKDTTHLNDLYEIPKYIDYITTGSLQPLKWKCDNKCPKCLKPHEFYETVISTKIKDSKCNKCIHLNKCDCMTDCDGFICLTCHNYFDDIDMKDNSCNTCKICRSKYNNNNIRLTINALVSHTYGRNRQGRKQKTSELSNDSIINLYENQNKCCAYSNIPLGFTKFGDWKITIERVNISNNYTIDNVILTCIEFQSGFRPWNKPKWHDFCLNYYKYQEPLNSIEMNEIEKQYQTALQKCFSKDDNYKKITKFVNEEKKEKKCHKCEEIKHIDNDFTKSGLKSHICKECISAINRTKKEILRSRLVILLNSSKHNTITRKNKKTSSKRKDLTHTLTFTELLDMWKSQNGRCYYSNYPMNMINDYQISLERKDNKLGYTKENCVLICLEFNVGGHEIYDLESNSNAYSWNKVKVCYAVKTYLDSI